jgi:hypothetical protein
MHRCREAQQADLLLDGHAWQFTTLREAVTTYRKLRAYRGAQWPDVAATMQRLFAQASPEDQAWFHREQARLGGDVVAQLVPQTAAPRATPQSRPRGGRQGRLLEETR